MNFIRFNRESFRANKESGYSENVTCSNKFLAYLRCAIVMVLMLCVGRVWGLPTQTPQTWQDKYSSWGDYKLVGSGTTGDPYLIQSVKDLTYFAYAVTGVKDKKGGAFNKSCFKLTSDIDLNDYWWVPIGKEAGNKNNTQLFLGTFDGGGHVIKNMWVDWSKNPEATEDFGLFAKLVSADGMVTTVKNLIIDGGHAIYNSSNNYNHNRNIGLLAGEIQGSVTLSKIVVRGGEIKSPDVSNSANAKVTSGSLVGLVGAGGNYVISDIAVKNVINFSELNGNVPVSAGGVFGQVLWNESIPAKLPQNIASDCTLTNNGHNNVVTGKFSGNAPAAFKTAEGGWSTSIDPNMFSFVSTEHVHANHLEAKHLYSFIAKNALGEDCSSNYNVQWVIDGVQFNEPVVSYPTSTKKRTVSVTITEKETNKTEHQEFEEEAEHWRLDVNHIYTDHFAGGSGTKTDPYLISNAAELVLLQDNVNNGVNATDGKYYALTEDIELGGALWHTIGRHEFDSKVQSENDVTKCFQGVFDGRGKIIKNLYFALNEATANNSKIYCLGLFSKVGGKASFFSTIANVIIDNALFEETAPDPNYSQNRLDNLGVLVGRINQYANIQNIIVRNSAITYNYKVSVVGDAWKFIRHIGGVIGYLPNEETALPNVSHIYSDVKIDITKCIGNVDCAPIMGRSNSEGYKYKPFYQDFYAKNNITWDPNNYDFQSHSIKVSNVGALTQSDYEDIFYVDDAGKTENWFGVRKSYNNSNCKEIKTIFNRNIITTGQNLDEVKLPEGYNNLLTWAFDAAKGGFYFLPVAAALRNEHESTHLLPYHELTFYFKDEKGVDQTANYTYKWGEDGETNLWEPTAGNKAKWKTSPIKQICEIGADMAGQPHWHESFIMAAESWERDPKHFYAENFSSKSGSTYFVKNGAELQYLNHFMEQGNATSGLTFCLADDVDLSGAEWKPLGNVRKKTGELIFKGKFDGRAHIIKNMTLNWTNEWNDSTSLNDEYFFGLFARTEGTSSAPAIVQNLILENAELTTFHGENFNLRNVGALVGAAGGYSQIRNIIVRDGKINDGGFHNIQLADKGFRVGGVIGTLSSNEVDIYALHADVDFSFANTTFNGKANTATTNPGASFGNIFGWVNIAKDLNYYFPAHLYALGSQVMPTAAKNISSGTIYGNSQQSATYPKFRIGWYYGSDLTSNIANDKKFNQGAIEDDRQSIADRFNYAIRSIDEDNEYGLYDWMVENKNGKDRLTFGIVPMLAETAWDDENCLYTLTVSAAVMPENATYKFYVDNTLIYEGNRNEIKLLYLMTGRDVYVTINESQTTNHITLSDRTSQLMTKAEHTDAWRIVLPHDDANQNPYRFGLFEPDANNDLGYKTDSTAVTVNYENYKVVVDQKVAQGNAGDDIGPLFMNIYYPFAGGLEKLYSNLRRKSFEMVDGYVYDIKEPFGVRTATYKRIYKKWVWQPLVLPYSLKFEDWAGRFDVVKLFDVHYILDENDDQIQEMKIQMIRLLWGAETEPNVPYMIRAIHPSETEVQTLESHDVMIYPTTPYNAQCANIEKDFSFISSYQGMGKNTYYAPDLTKKGTPEFDKGLTPDKSKSFNHPWPSSVEDKDKMGAVENKEIYVLTSGCWLPVTNTASLRPQRYYLRITDRTKNNPYKDSYAQKSIPTIRMEIIGEGEMEIDDTDDVATAIEQIATADDAAESVKVKAAEIGLHPGLYLIGGKWVMVE